MMRMKFNLAAEGSSWRVEVSERAWTRRRLGPLRGTIRRDEPPA